MTAMRDVTDLLDEAQHLVYGDRNADYGHPADDLTRVGRIWGALLGLPDIPPATVAQMMRGLKLARQVHRPKRDNLVDEVGYVLCEALCDEPL